MTQEKVLVILRSNFMNASKYDTFKHGNIYIDFAYWGSGFCINTWKREGDYTDIHEYRSKPWMNLSIL